MNQCNNQCIYYRIITDKSKTPSTKLTCDMREGEEIKNIPKHIKENCNDFKSYKDIKLKYELLFSIKNILTKV